MARTIDELERSAQTRDAAQTLALLRRLVPEFESANPEPPAVAL
jgi:hypothetical protein